MTVKARALLALVMMAVASAPAGADDGIIDVPVAFSVANTNTSELPCMANGLRYEVRGRLVAPVAALSAQIRSVTLYLHSPALGSRAEWRFNDVPGYDHGLELAKLGHASVTIDRLGYGGSDIPPGLEMCLGSAADVAHQVVQQLRQGNYTSPNKISFQRVALAGFSGGGIVAQIEAYSFSDIDALVVIGWGASGHAPGFFAVAAADASPCAAGGEPKYAGSAAGYVQLFKDDAAFDEWLFANTDPVVLAAARQARERDPCGEIGSFGQVIVNDLLRLSEIEVPVLLVYGAQDAVYPGSAPEDHRARFTGSADVTLIRPPAAGHVVMLERTAGLFRSMLSDWFSARGF